MAPSEILKRFINDPNSPKFLSQPQQRPEPQLPPITTSLSETSLSPKARPASSSSKSPERSSSLSTSPAPSILSRKESDSSKTSTALSDSAESLEGYTETMSMGGRSYRLPCTLNGIIRCLVTFRPSEQAEWYSHSVSHYGDAGPPSHALCIFCDTVFDSNDPATCWSNRMSHIADHFQNGWTIEMSRPDFPVMKDMWNKGCISDDDYKQLCQYTERPYCDGLRPHDYIPEEHKKKQRVARAKENRIIVAESRQEAREWARERKLRSSKKAKSMPKNAGE